MGPIACSRKWPYKLALSVFIYALNERKKKKKIN